MGWSPFAPVGAAERSLPGGHSRGFSRRQCQPLPHGGPDREEKLATVRALHALALQRVQSPSQLALQMGAARPVVSCALIGASHPNR